MLRTLTAQLEQHLAEAPYARRPDLALGWRELVSARGLDAWAGVKAGAATAPESAPLGSPELKLLSKVLTYPLTLALGAARLGMGAGAAPGGVRRLHVHVVGARAEATLPWIFWLELGRLDPAATWDLRFVGPDVDPRLVGAPVAAGSVRAAFSNAPYEADAPSRPPPDLLCLFNPGLSRVREWGPALDVILGANRPVLCTGFNADDYATELAWCDALARHGRFVGRVERCGENPMRSLWTARSAHPMPPALPLPGAEQQQRHVPPRGAAGFEYATNAFWWLLVPDGFGAPNANARRAEL